MGEHKNRSGKRVDNSTSARGGYWQQHKDWVAGLSRGQKIRYRFFQGLTVMSVIIILVTLGLRLWIKMPEMPVVGPQGSSGSSQGASVELGGGELPDIAQSGRQEGIYTFLVAGRDVVSGSTDTILLLSYDINEKEIHGLNLPRDTMVNTKANSKRLNSVYARNRGSSDLAASERVERGMTALKKEVANLTGITPDFYVLVEWEAIGELVEALGGVEFEVPFDMDYDDPYQDPPLHIHQKAGLRTLNGEDAMEVIRWRKNNTGSSGGDVARLAIQQDFLKAVVKTCLQSSTFLKVPELARIFTENVSTDLTVGNILAFAQAALGMDPEGGVSFETAPLADSFNYKGAALITLDSKGVLEIVNKGMNPYLRDIQAGDLKLVYRNADGSFGVTNSALVDPEMGRPAVSSQGRDEPEDEPEVPIEPEDPDSSEGSDVTDDPDGGDTGESEDEPQIGDEPVTSPSDDDSTEGAGQQPPEDMPPSNPIDAADDVLDADQILPQPSNRTEIEDQHPSQDAA